MVPVLSSRITSTSPDASTARPLIARTLNRATRSMPAMPIAESSPPIVVGMRHTSSATRATVSTVAPGVVPERAQGDRRHQEDDRQAGEQDRERDLVGRALALGAFDERDHAVEERLAGIGGDEDHQAIADERGAAGDRAPDVGPGLLEDGRRLAGDRRLVDEADALDHVAVAGDRLAFLDDDDVALAELGRADRLERAVGQAPMGDRLGAGPAQGGGLGPTARLGDGLGVGREQDREPQPDGDLDLEASRGPASGWSPSRWRAR